MVESLVDHVDGYWDAIAMKTRWPRWELPVRTHFYTIINKTFLKMSLGKSLPLNAIFIDRITRVRYQRPRFGSIPLIRRLDVFTILYY